MRRHHLGAVRAAYLMVGDRGLAEEIVQSAFVKAYERIGSFDPTRPFGPWFSRIVINDSITAASRRRKMVSLDELGESTGVADSDPRSKANGRTRAAGSGRRSKTCRPAGAVVQRYFLGMSEA